MAVPLGASAVSGAFPDPYTVHRVVDGDTIVVAQGEELTTVRLLNVDTPETKDPDEPVQCLGPEATAFLTERLPAGTEVKLEFDKERTDRYGRTLAGVFVGDELINAAIARAGLGVPVLFKPNGRFLGEVEAAAAEAEREGVGLYDATGDCTPSARLAQQAVAVQALPQVPPSSVDPSAALESAAALEEVTAELITALDAPGLHDAGWAVFAGHTSRHLLEDLRATARTDHEKVSGRHKELKAADADYRAEQKRLEQERLEKQRRERERAERERAQREEQQRQERARREQAEHSARRDSGPSSSKSSSSKRSAPKKSSSKNSAPKQFSSTKSSSKKSSSKKSSGSGCVPYGRVYSYSEKNGYTGKRYGMPGGTGYRKCR